MKELGPFRGDRTDLDGVEAGHWSRDEWMLMYMRGLDIKQIARVCRVPARKVDASIRSRLNAEPWRRGRRLILHDQPALPRPGTPIATRSQRWTARLQELQRFHADHDRCPKATSTDPLESSLAHWIYAQRHRHRTHQLKDGQLELMNTVPGWYRPARDEKEAQSWQEHLEAVTAYVAAHGRLPTYRNGHKDLRNTLAAWIWATPPTPRRNTPPGTPRPLGYQCSRVASPPNHPVVDVIHITVRC